MTALLSVLLFCSVKSVLLFDHGAFHFSKLSYLQYKLTLSFSHFHVSLGPESCLFSALPSTYISALESLRTFINQVNACRVSKTDRCEFL